MAKLQVGFSRLDMTPPLGAHMIGYGVDRYVEGILDPLYINAVAAMEGDKTVVVMTLDLILLGDKPANQLRKLVAEATGLEENAIMLCCTHTHTGGTVDGEIGDQQYFAWMCRRLRDAAVMAIKDCKPVEQILAYEGVCPGLTFIRRFQMRGGYCQTWPPEKDADILAEAGTNDESLRMVRILRTNGEELLLVNFQSHPDNVGGSKISADYPGFFSKKVEANRPNTKCIYFNGASGQLISRDIRYGTVTREKYVRARVAGHKLADFVLAHIENAVPVEAAGIGYGEQAVACRTKWDPEKLPEAERIIAIHERGDEQKEIGPAWYAGPMVTNAYRIKSLAETKQECVTVLTSGVAFGGLAFLGISGEPFCELGREIREHSPYPVTFVCGTTNGYGDYYPTAEAYDQGGHEPNNTRLARGCGEKIVNSSDVLLRKMFSQTQI